MNPLKQTPAELPDAEQVDITALLQSYIDGNIDLICVLGPTASGKTKYAVGLAKQMNALLAEGAGGSGSGAGDREGSLPEEWRGRQAEILSADSRQVYRGMSIGTGKDLDEYEDVPYHLIDIAPAGSQYNIYEYQRDFEEAYRGVRARGNVAILCGGSGLYIEAATRGYSLPEVPADPELRASLEAEDTETLISRLAALKPLHNSTDYDTRKRLIRALEIAVYEKEHPVTRTVCLPKSTYYIGTLVSREERNARIDRRLDARIAEGLVEEVRTLLDGSHPALAPEHKAIPAEDLIYYGLEYKFVTQHLLGQTSLQEMRDALATAIHQFAKRQMTWFRGMERKGIRIHWTEV